VKAAIRKVTTLNKARIQSPTRNRYRLKPRTVVEKRDIPANDTAPPSLLNVTAEIAAAAALIAEVHAVAQANHSELIGKRAGWF
jgi:hypothetical protein